MNSLITYLGFSFSVITLWVIIYRVMVVLALFINQLVVFYRVEANTVFALKLESLGIPFLVGFGQVKTIIACDGLTGLAFFYSRSTKILASNILAKTHRKIVICWRNA